MVLSAVAYWRLGFRDALVVGLESGLPQRWSANFSWWRYCLLDFGTQRSGDSERKRLADALVSENPLARGSRVSTSKVGVRCL